MVNLVVCTNKLHCNCLLSCALIEKEGETKARNVQNMNIVKNINAKHEHSIQQSQGCCVTFTLKIMVKFLYTLKASIIIGSLFSVVRACTHVLNINHANDDVCVVYNVQEKAKEQERQ